MKKNNRLCFRLFKIYSPLPVHALWVLILFLLLCGPVHALDFQYITAPEVKNMMEKDPRTVLINVLSTIEYDGLHITGSINIPIIKFRSSELLPHNMDSPIITYCMGESWPYSSRAARIAAEMGYTNVYCFTGGIPEWRSFAYPMAANKEYANMKVRKISPAKLYKRLQKDKNLFILDVRPISYSSAHENVFIKDANICPMVYLADWYHRIPKDKKIVITDWTNKKAILAAKFLTKKDFDVLGILKGGIIRWREEKLPLEHKEIVDGRLSTTADEVTQ